MRLVDGFSIKTRLLGAFAAVLLLFVAFAAFSTVEIRRLNRFTSTLYTHPLTVSNRALQAGRGVLRMHRTMKDVTTAESNVELEAAVGTVQQEEGSVYAHLDVIRNRILGEDGKKLEREARAAFTNWRPIRNEVIALARSGKWDAANRITKGKGADYVALLEKRMFELNAHARSKADAFMENADRVKQDNIRRIMFFMGTVSLVSILIAVFTGRGILRSVFSLKKTMGDISRSGKLSRSDLTGNNEIAEMAASFNLVVDQLTHQAWIRDGLNRFNRTLSGNHSMGELAKRGISYLARYIEACNGAVYLYDGETDLCEVEATFAAVESPHMGERFALGEGIVGQVAMEKRGIRLSDIDPGQAAAATGTLVATPRNIYALPLLHEGKLLGVLELATFGVMGEKEVGFLDAAASTLATLLNTADQGRKIRTLYEDSQQSNLRLTARTTELNEANERLGRLNSELQVQSRELKNQAEELKAQKSELEIQRIQVEQADRLKSEFLSNMSHELRTPLNSILALSQLMLARGTGKDAEKEREYLGVMERNGRGLLSLINDILDLSKIEAGKMDLYISEFMPADLAGRAVETAETLAVDKDLKITIRPDKVLPIIRSDGEKVYQIILNLITNAVKFTEKGGVTVGVKAAGEGVAFVVSDTGIGIPAEDLPHVFDEFRQVDGSTTRARGGTGLGLSICRKLAKLLGGEISVTSIPGEGSTFTLTLPESCDGEAKAAVSLPWRRESPQPAGNADALPGPAASGESPRILVVEDNPMAALQIRTALEDRGYAVHVATGGNEAIEAVDKEVPDAVVLDLMMPEVDGFEVLEEIRSTPRTFYLPVLVLTAKALSAEDRAKLSHNNIRELIQKGALDRRQLVGRIEKMLGETGRNSQPSGKSQEHASESSPEKNSEEYSAEYRGDAGEDVSEGKPGATGGSPTGRGPSGPGDSPAANKTVLVVEDNPDNLTTINAILEDAGYRCLHAGDGDRAVAVAGEAVPDIILMDIQLPGTGGLSAAGRIKSDDALRHIPIIAVTARAMQGDRELFLASGCDDYIAKPVEPKGLVETMERWLNRAAT